MNDGLNDNGNTFELHVLYILSVKRVTFRSTLSWSLSHVLNKSVFSCPLSLPDPHTGE